MKKLSRPWLAALALIAVTALSGCAYYATPAGSYSYSNAGRAVYVSPYPYGPTVYSDPWFGGPPVFFNFGVHSFHDRHPHSSYRGYHPRRYQGYDSHRAYRGHGHWQGHGQRHGQMHSRGHHGR